MIRHTEETQVGAIKIKNSIYLWDNTVDLMQTCTLAASVNQGMVSLSPETAVKFAKMILHKYEGSND